MTTRWTKTRNDWNCKVYAHESGKVRVTRHAASRSYTHRDGRFAVGRSTMTSRWSTIDIHVSALVELGVSLPDCATVIDGWARVEDVAHRIGDANLAEAKRIAEELLEGRRGLEVRTWGTGACLRMAA